MEPPSFCLMLNFFPYEVKKKFFSEVKLNIDYGASGFLFNVEYWVLKNWEVGCGNSERFKIYICMA